MSDNTNNTQEAAIRETIAEDRERFLTFMSDGLTFAVSTNYIIEIVTDYAITFLPMVPDFVKGIINLRGQIIPIIDIRLRLGKMPIDYTRTTCIIVLEINAVSIGIVVDSVSQVLDINKENISSVPVNNQQEMVNGMISLDDGSVVLLLDCAELVDEQLLG